MYAHGMFDIMFYFWTFSYIFAMPLIVYRHSNGNVFTVSSNNWKGYGTDVTCRVILIFQYWWFSNTRVNNSSNWMLLWFTFSAYHEGWNWGIYLHLKLLLWITHQPLGDNCLDFPFSSDRQHGVLCMFDFTMYF